MLVLLALGAVVGYNNGLGRTPPMGEDYCVLMQATNLLSLCTLL